MIKDIFFAIGDFFTMSFKVLPSLGNLPNYLFMLVIAVASTYWVLQLVEYSKDGHRFDKYQKDWPSKS